MMNMGNVMTCTAKFIVSSDQIGDAILNEKTLQICSNYYI